MVLLSSGVALIEAQAALKESDLGRVMCRDILNRYQNPERFRIRKTTVALPLVLAFP